jgi:hypothetical protein
MANEFDHLLPPKDAKIPDNIDVDVNPFSHLLPTEETQKFKVTDKGNPGSNIDLENENPFEKFMPESEETYDGDRSLWEKVGFATKLGFSDTVRGVAQMSEKNLGFGDTEEMKADQKKLYEYMQNPDGSTNWAVAGAYFGSALLDPAGWLVPVTKTRVLYKAAKYGFVSAGIVGGLGYVDDESILDSRAKQAAASAVGGAIISPIIVGVAKKLKGEKVFTRESLGIPGFEPNVKAANDAKLKNVKVTAGAGEKDLIKQAREEIKMGDDIISEDMITKNKTELLRGPRKIFRDFIVEPYQRKFGKPAMNYLTNGEYGAEAGTAGAGALIGYAGTDEEAPMTTKLSRAFVGAVAGFVGIRGSRHIKIDRTFGKGEDKTVELSETMFDWLGRNFIDGYGLPSSMKGLKAESQGFANHVGMKFNFMAKKIQANLTPDEQVVLHNLLQGDIKIKSAPMAIQNLSKQARAEITEIGQHYVDMGLITPQTFKRNKDIYLKRSYKGKTEDRPFGEELKTRGVTDTVTLKQYDEIYKKQKAFTTTTEVQNKKTKLFESVLGKGKKIEGHRGWEIAPSSKVAIKKIIDDSDAAIKVTKSKKRKSFLLADKKRKLDEVQVDIRWELTKQQRVGLSEIEDAAFGIAETGRGFAQTLSQFRLYNSISKQEWVYDSLNTLPIGKKSGYTQMPETTMGKTAGKFRYGNLAGKYVPTDVYKNLVAVNRNVQQQDFYKTYRKYNSIWKVSKTAWNPTVHVNNVMSNFILHDLVDAQFKYLKPAWTALTTHGKTITKDGKKVLQRSKLVESATRHGVFEADFVNVELKQFQGGKTFPYSFDESKNVMDNSLNAANNVFNDVKSNNIFSSLTKFYQFEDQVFRLSVYQDRLAKGFSFQDAALDARKSFIDYNIDAPAINWMRNSVTPFLAYTYRIIPLLAETAIVRPWKYVKYATIGYGLNKMGDLIGGGNEEAERGVMPERKQGRFMGMGFLPHRNIKVPFPKFGKDSETKAPMYQDITRFVPGGDIMDLGSPGIPGLPAPLQPSLGLAGEVMFPLMGYDLFRQEKIKGQTGIHSEDIKIRLSTMFEKLVPNMPFLPGSYSSKKLESTRKSLDSPFKADQTELGALFTTLGFKFERADLEKLKTSKTFELKRKIDGYKEQINIVKNKFRKGLINRDTAELQINKTATKIRELADKYNIKLEQATFADLREPLTIPSPFDKRN